MAKSATKKLDVTSFLTEHAAPKGKKGKPEIPVLEGHEALADRAYGAYRAFKDAEAGFKAVEGEVLGLTGVEYEKRSKGGEHTKSLDIPGGETPGVQVSYADKFSALDVKQEAGLREQLGSKFDAYFEQKRTLTLKADSTDDATIKMLLEKLGPEGFRRLFDIKIELVCKSDMDRKQFEIPEAVRALCGLKQSKAALKIRKED